MSIGVPSALGNGSANSGTTIAVSNAGNGAAGRAWVAIFVSAVTALTVSGVSGGGLSGWAQACTAPITGLNGNDYVLTLWSADAPSGTSGSITVTMSGTIDAAAAVAVYDTGIAASSPLDNSGGAADNVNGGTWSTGPVTMTNAADLLLSISASDNFGAQTSSVTSPWAEIAHLHTAQDLNLAVNYQIVSSAGSYTGTGGWSAGPFSEATMLAGFKAAGAGGTTYNRSGTIAVGP